ncbi:MAG: SRPBCC domain-containing protein [Cyanobacteria bacterium J06636_16]
MTSTLVFKATYPHAPERVWQALTHPKALAAWLMDNNFKPCVGHHFQFKEASLPGLETVIDCEVIALEPPTRLVYTWQACGMSAPSLVTWMLTPIEGGTRLQLHHSGLTPAPSPLHPASLLQKHCPSTEQQRQPSSPQALLTFPSSPAYPTTTESIGPSVLLGIPFEAEWNHRLNEALPEVLAQLVTTSQIPS